MISCSHKYISKAHAHRNTRRGMVPIMEAENGAPLGVRRFGVGRLEFGVWSLEFLYGRGRLIPHADVYRVIHRRSDTTNIGRSFRLYTETWCFLISWT